MAEKVADDKVDEVVQALTRQGKPPAKDYAGDALAEIERNLRRPKYVTSFDPVWVPATVEEATPAFYRNGWTDGLPIVPPTRRAVDRMLAHTDWAPDEIVGKMPPKWGKATVEKIAVNAVMAGCLPEHMPLLVAAAQIMCDPAWDLYSTQASTNPGAPLLIVNGPIAKELDINCGFNIFGQGWQANATIGRAIRLMMMNIGGGLPGITDKATHGQPAKYTFCIAENEEDSPWEPLHVEKGFARETSAITMYGAQAIHPAIILDNTAESCLILTADAMCMMGTDTMYYAGIPMVILNPRLAGVLASAGYSKADVKKWLFEHARVPLSKFPPNSVQYLKMRRAQYDYSSPDAMIPAIDRPEDLEIVVSGAHGSWSVFLPNHAKHTPPRTLALTLKDGTPVKSIGEFRG
ncbi:MAG: hypothetical protein HYX92_18140 [Chloroflexi bacterium]|nr:hypothetical protein [Chloroflexota bacterium]